MESDQLRIINKTDEVRPIKITVTEGGRERESQTSKDNNETEKCLL